MCINKSKKIKTRKTADNICFNIIANNYLSIKTFVLLSLVISMSSIFLHNAVAKSKNDIEPGANWKYFKGIKDAPENWQNIDFDDADWFEGASGFGYGNNPKNGKIKENKDGTFTYIPDEGFTGTDTFKYKVKDNDGAISEAKVIINVGGLSTFEINSEATSLEDATTNDEDRDDNDKSDFKGTSHVFKDDIDNINKRPDINDDFVAVDKNAEIMINVVENDNDDDGTIVPETVLLGNSEDGELDDMQGRFSGILVRKEFIINDPEDIDELCLSVICDGQFVAFINGIEVIRSEVPVNETLKIGGFAHETFPGVNVLAIKCSNDNIDSSDFSFIPALEIEEKGGR